MGITPLRECQMLAGADPRGIRGSVWQLVTTAWLIQIYTLSMRSMLRLFRMVNADHFVVVKFFFATPTCASCGGILLLSEESLTY